MAVLKFIFLLIVIAARSLTVSSYGLGEGVELRKHNVVGEVASEGGAQIFAKIPKTCVNEQAENQTRNEFGNYEETKSFYRSVGTTVEISANLQSDYTLGFTLDSSTNSISGTDRTVKGNNLLIMTATSKDILVRSCLNSQDFAQNLMDDLQALPTTIEQPWLSGSWAQYDLFLTKYGSHLVSAVAYGSSINQFSFSKSEYSYSQHDFEVKSCLSLMGPTVAGMANVSLCAGVTQQELDEAHEYSMSNTLVINGGKTETRNELLNVRTDELITQFMNEANYTRSPIYYKYMPIWELIQAHDGSSNNDYIKAVNMEQYYRGYLNYGCTFMQGPGINLRVFDLSPHSTPTTPRYECTLAAEGCHDDRDCKYRLIQCKCQGYSCVRYNDVTQDTGIIKEVPYINEADKWYWHGCDWNVWAISCCCKSENKERFIAWSGDNKGELGSSATLTSNKQEL